MLELVLVLKWSLGSLSCLAHLGGSYIWDLSEPESNFTKPTPLNVEFTGILLQKMNPKLATEDLWKLGGN